MHQLMFYIFYAPDYRLPDYPDPPLGAAPCPYLGKIKKESLHQNRMHTKHCVPLIIQIAAIDAIPLISHNSLTKLPVSNGQNTQCMHLRVQFAFYVSVLFVSLVRSDQLGKEGYEATAKMTKRTKTTNTATNDEQDSEDDPYATDDDSDPDFPNTNDGASESDESDLDDIDE